jgi:hypothetical protein
MQARPGIDAESMNLNGSESPISILSTDSHWHWFYRGLRNARDLLTASCHTLFGGSGSKPESLRTCDLGHEPYHDSKKKKEKCIWHDVVQE